MQARNVKIDPRLLTPYELSPNRKNELRQEIVLDLIRNRPNMKPLTLNEVGRACNYTSNGSAVSLLRSMVKQGLIIRHELGKFVNAYTINEDRPQRSTPAKAVEKPVVKPAPEQAPTMSNEARAIRNVVLEYYWSKGNDSLRQFVGWLESGGLDNK